jgi:predicted kinase
MRTLTLIRGLPGSGKSTLAAYLTHADPKSRQLEADMFFVTDGEYKFDASRIGEAHAWCQRMTAKNLSDGRDVFVTNTFTTLKEMRPYYEMSHEFCCDFNVITCQGKFGNVHNVPQETLDKMAARFFYGDVIAALEKV